MTKTGTKQVCHTPKEKCPKNYPTVDDEDTCGEKNCAYRTSKQDKKEDELDKILCKFCGRDYGCGEREAAVCETLIQTKTQILALFGGK